MTCIPPWENIIETKKCAQSQQSFFITDKDIKTLDSLSPICNGEKYTLPWPKLCPSERQRKRLAWRNELGFHKRTCDLSGQPIVSLYSPDKPYKIYSQQSFWSDSWSPFEYGCEFDFNTPFFPQFDELLHRVPIIGSVVIDSENSEFNNYVGKSKDIFMSVRVGDSRDIYYCYLAIKSDNCIDCSYITECSYCLWCMDCETCNETFYSRNCSHCQNVWYSKDCSGCQDCLLCVGIHNQQYCIQNKHYSKEDYERKKQEILTQSPESILTSMLESIPQRENENHQSVQSLWNHLKNCEGVFWAFDSVNINQGKYLIWGESGEHQYDCNYAHYGSFTYETISTYYASNVLFTYGAYNSASVLYSFQANGAQNVFGCTNLKKGNNCILNTAYSKQEYDTLCSKIIQHMQETEEWGSFFPYHMSPFGYNETIAQQIHPIKKEEAQIYGAKWHDEMQDTYEGNAYSPSDISEYNENTVGSEQAKKNISDCLWGTFICEKSNKPFRINKKELAFYIQYNINLPTLCPEERTKKRTSLRNPFSLWKRSCDKCQQDIMTSYSPDRKEKVYCEKCYRETVY